MDKIKKYIIERGKEASTWRGLVFILTAFGVGITPDLAAAILSAGVGVVGLIGALFPDK